MQHYACGMEKDRLSAGGSSTQSALLVILEAQVGWSPADDPRL
jgi:hypothetical protein